MNPNNNSKSVLPAGPHNTNCEQLQELCASLPGAVYRFKQNPKGKPRFSYVSEGVSALLGVKPEDLYSDDNFGLGYVHPDDVAAINSSMAKSAISLTPWQNIFRVKNAQGVYTKYVRASSSPAPQTDGSIIWNGIMMDVTDTIDAQNHLLLMERALEHTAEGIVIVNVTLPGNPIIYANKAFSRLTGYSSAEIIGNNCRFLQGPDTNPETIQLIRDSIAARKSFAGELLNYRKDGTPFWNYLSLNPIFNEKGEVNHYVGFQKDITQRHQAAENIQNLNEYLEHKVAERTESLERANEEMEAFSYTISHDLQAPLRVMSGFLKIINNEHKQHITPEVQNYLQMIEQNVTRMGSLVKHVLAFARLGKKSLKISQTDMQAEVQALLSPHFLKALYPHTQVMVKHLPQALCDASLIGQVWYNLIGNALKYSAKKEQPLVEVGATLHDNETTYYVKDNGAGFNMAYAPKLFGAFQRLHTHEEFEGQGIGLATAHRIITRHGGRIWAEAREGQGATFYFTLPSTHPREN